MYIRIELGFRSSAEAKRDVSSILAPPRVPEEVVEVAGYRWLR